MRVKQRNHLTQFAFTFASSNKNEVLCIFYYFLAEQIIISLQKNVYMFFFIRKKSSRTDTPREVEVDQLRWEVCVFARTPKRLKSKNVRTFVHSFD